MQSCTRVMKSTRRKTMKSSGNRSVCGLWSTKKPTVHQGTNWGNDSPAKLFETAISTPHPAGSNADRFRNTEPTMLITVKSGQRQTNRIERNRVSRADQTNSPGSESTDMKKNRGEYSRRDQTAAEPNRVSTDRITNRRHLSRPNLRHPLRTKTPEHLPRPPPLTLLLLLRYLPSSVKIGASADDRSVCAHRK